MSSQADEGYLPSLDRFYSRTTSIISWTDVEKQLSLSRSASDVADLKSFLTNDRNLATLAKALSPFDRPTHNTKQEFESRTAPIHVSSPTSGSKEIEQLKKDALWLTTQLEIDEVTSLRIALLEWQRRSIDLVLGKLNAVATSGDHNTGKADVPDHARHERLLRLFLEERSAIRSVSALLAAVDAGDKTLSARFGHEPWLESLSEGLRSSREGKNHRSLADCFGHITSIIDLLEDTKSWPTCYQVDFGLHDAFLSALLLDLASILRQAIVEVFHNGSGPNAQDILVWFRLMKRTTYLRDFHPSNDGHTYHCELVQALVAILSTAILKLPEVVAELEGIAEELSGKDLIRSVGKSYIHDDTCIRELNLLIFEAATCSITIAAPAIYAWSIIGLYVRDIARAEQEELRMIEDEHDASGRHGSVSRRPSAIELKYDSFQDMNLGEARDDPPGHLARQAADDLRVYSVVANLSRMLSEIYAMPLETSLAETCRSVLFDLVRESLPMVSYDENVIEATLAVLKPVSSIVMHFVPQPLVTKFLKDQSRFVPLILEPAISRYPYELTPCIQILDVSSMGTNAGSAESTTNVTEMLTHLKYMTLMLPEHFRGYILEHEEEGANAFRLLEDLPLFTSKSTALSRLESAADTDKMVIYDSAAQGRSIPRGTRGIIVRDSRPFIVQMQHEHNGLHYVSLLLETYLDSALHTVAPPAAPIDANACVDIVTLLGSILHTSDKDETTACLQQLAEVLPEGQDAISVIAEIMDLELLSFPDQSGRYRSTELVVSCLNFFISLHHHTPERLWSILSQSSLISSNSGTSPLGAIASGSRNTYYTFALAVMKLYKAMLDDALEGLVQRKKLVRHTSKSRRFDSRPTTSVFEASERTIANVLSTYTRVVLAILQRLAAEPDFGKREALATVSIIMTSLHQLLIAVYGIQGGSSSSTGFAVALKPAAELVLATLLDKEHSLSLLIAPLEAVTQLYDACVPRFNDAEACAQTVATLQLLTTLIRTAQQQARSSRVATLYLIKAMPSLATLYAARPQARQHVAELLSVLSEALVLNGGEPTSLFGHLQPTEGQNFLRLLSELDHPLQDDATECALWNLFSAACENGQQWFAMYLLTGILPRDKLKSNDKSTVQTTLSKALDLLTDIKSLAPERALAIMTFVSKAQKLWIWATALIRSHNDFMDSILAWLRELKPIARSANPADALLAAREYAVAAALCDVLAVSVHASTEIGDDGIIRLLLPKLGFLTQHAAQTDVYNKALHRRLQDNLTAQFSGLDISDFKRTLVNPAQIGRSYLYDTDIASRALAYDQSWHGTGKRGSSGFGDEFTRANINWSLVDASRDLLDKWRVLAIALASSQDLNTALTSVLVTAAEACLDASTQTDLATPDAGAILQTRADLTFGLLSRLARVPVDASQARSIFMKTWTLVRSSPVDFDIANADVDLTYYRSLLRILLLTLNLQNSNKIADKSLGQAHVTIDYDTGSVLVEIVTRTVTTGFRALCSNLHESINTALPDDFALLTALMQAVLSSDVAKHFYPQLADAIALSAASRSALSLFSWSDNLSAVTNNEPVYGELAAMFLTTISRIPRVAEQLALDGALAQLSSASISNLLRTNNGKGPFSLPNIMFAIWTDAFLPLCINMLEAVGPPVASEISSFLNSFPQQLTRAEKALVNASPSPRDPRAGAVTLGLLSEARDLILIAQVLRASIQLGAAEGIASLEVTELKYNIGSVADDVDAITKSQRSLRDRLTPANPREMALYGDKNANGSNNMLEVAVIKEIAHIKSLAAE